MQRKMTIAGFGILLLCIIGGYIALERYAEQKLSDQLRSSATAISFSDLNVQLLGRSISVDSLRVADSTGTFYLNIPRLNLKGISWHKMYDTKKIYAGFLSVPNLQFQIDSNPSQIIPAVNSTSIYGRIGRIRVDSLSGEASWNEQSDSAQHWAIDQLALELASDEEGRFGKEGHFLLEGLHWKAPKNLYTLYCDTISANMARRTMKVRALHMEPRHPRDTFSNFFGYRIGRMELFIPGIQLHGLRYDSMLRSGAVLMDRLTIEKTHCSVYENQSVDPDYDRLRKLPHVVLRELAIPLSIDTLQVRMSHFTYETTNPTTGDIGVLSFERSYLSAYHISNRSSDIQINPRVEVDIKSSFGGRTPFDMRYTFSLKSSRFHCSGRLGAYDLKHTNSILIPIAFMDIEAGQCHELSFEIHSNDTLARGEVRFAYEDLQVQALREDMKKEQKILSFLANNLIIRSNNLKDKGQFKVSSFELKRPKYKSFFGYQWLCLRRGLIHTILPKFVAKAITN